MRLLRTPIAWVWFVGGLGFMGVLAAREGTNAPVRETPLASAGSGGTGFVRLASRETGVAFTNHLSEILALNNQILENGAGVTLGDVDGDGRCDLYLCGAENDNRLYRNLGGWKFAEVTSDAGVGCPGQLSTGAVLSDVDGDGDLDLLVNGVGVGTRLFLNDGRGRFTESGDSGLQRQGAATSMALADLDGDGDLDLYVARYRTISARGEDRPPAVSARVVQGRLVVTPADRFFGLLHPDGAIEVVEKGEPDLLYWNDGRGRFRAASWTDGTFLDAEGRALTAPPEDWGLSVSVRDLNGDRHPDLYVCNDFLHSRDRLWLGDGQGRFRAASPAVLRGFPWSSMAVDVADINRDGHDDVLVAEMLSREHRTRQRQRANALQLRHPPPVMDPAFQMEHPRNVLLVSRGDGTFADLAWMSGLAATDWTWNLAFLDVDLDGWEDLLVATGNAHDVLDLDAQAAVDRAGARRTQPILSFYPPLPQANLAFRNQGNLTFIETGAVWGFDAPGVSQGMALGDLDGDGDLDVVVNNLNQEAWLYRNDSPAPRLAVRLRGRAPNTQGIGARLAVDGVPAASLPPQSQTVVAGGRYLGSDQPMRSFAGGGATRLALEVRWPGGKVSRIPHARPGTLLEIAEPSDSGTAATPSAGPGTTWFADGSESAGHQHRGNAGGKGSRQPLLPYALDADGPGVSWFDVDGDGWDDLLIGGGIGDRVAVYRNRSGDGFERWTTPWLETPLQRDAATVLGWEQGPDGATLMAALSNGEGALEPGPGVQAVDFRTGAVRDIAPARVSGVGPLLMADVDGDGDLDLFEGGRVQTGRWPEPASSVLHRNEGGTFRPDAANNRPLDRVGLVRGAVFSDLDSDGDPDLILAREWGAPKILRNEGGRLEPWDPPLSWLPPLTASPASRYGTLSALTGLWTSVTAGDFDGDGRPDLILGNWGRNVREHAFPGVQLWFGDFSGDGGVEFIEALADPRTATVVPWRARDALAPVMPWLVENRPTARAFAEASLDELLAGRPAPAGRLTLATTESLVLLNRGTSFLASPLPLEAQVAPVFGLAVADFNGDGKEDLFVAQNFFPVEPETSRLDAGRGLLLEGDGRGGFLPVPGQTSGIQLSGEQRGAAVADINHDGRPDLAVGQHSGPTRIFLNQWARPGLRLRLRGLRGNPVAVGASVRLESAGAPGPAREVRAGGGHRSQDSAVLVLASPEPPEAVAVRWPGGAVRRIPVPPGARFLEIRQDDAGL